MTIDVTTLMCVYVCMCAGDHNLLVLFDQHAAHERVRLELLLKGTICVVGTRFTHGWPSSAGIYYPIKVKFDYKYIHVKHTE